jgi:hypothetical protein
MKINNQNAKSSINIVKIVFAFGLIVLNCFAIKNLYLLSRDMLYGDFSAEQLIPHPIYPLVRLPETAVTLKYGAVNRIGSDFAQIYFPAQEITHLDYAYDHKKTIDPWGRPSRYAPALISFCSISICRLDYGYACLTQMLVQYLLFFLIVYLAFRSLGIKEYFWFTLLCANICLFLTPVGLSWFERGQFSLYVGSSFLMLVVGLLRKNPAWIVIATLIAFIKWTAFPVMVIFLAVYLLNSRTVKEFRYGIFIIALFSSTIALLTLLPVFFVKGTGVFLFGLINQELNDNPTGLSLFKLLPRYIVKLLPLLLIVLGYINIRNCKGIFTYLIPYMIGVTMIMLLYPTKANDYSAPSLMGFAPVIIYWAGQTEFKHQAATKVLLYAYIFFVLLASFSTSITHSVVFMIIIYLVFSIIFIVSPSIFAKYLLRQKGGKDLLLTPC